MVRISIYLVLCLLVSGSAWLGTGCAYFSKSASVQSAVDPSGTPERAGRVVVPVFIQEKYTTRQGTSSWPDNPLTDRFVTGLLQQGYIVVDRAIVRKILKENGLSSRDVQREDNIPQIGVLLHADVVVLGRLTLVEQADGRIQSRKITVRGIRVSDGQVVFSLSAIDTTVYRILSGEDLVDQGIAAMFGVAEDSAKKSANPLKAVKPTSSIQATVDTRVPAEIKTETLPRTTKEDGSDSNEDIYSDPPVTPDSPPSQSGESVTN